MLPSSSTVVVSHAETEWLIGTPTVLLPAQVIHASTLRRGAGRGTGAIGHLVTAGKAEPTRKREPGIDGTVYMVRAYRLAGRAAES